MKPIVLLISVDGMRPDGLLQANTPTIDRLMATGTYTLKARTVMPSVTLPCHTSMLRGVDVPRHGITTNIFTPLARPVPSLFDAAHSAGLRTGSFYNWGELRDLAHPQSLTMDYMIQASHRPHGDRYVADAVSQHVGTEEFDFVFVYMGCTDTAGHDHGWMTDTYIDTISEADECIGQILESVQQAGRESIALVMADHGGHERSHGTEMDEDMTIPWILSGSGIPKAELNGQVRIFDTAPTLAALMGLTSPPEWDGTPVISVS
jgi:predicted AlkP superfamily pyrophosphatase or phosphodiesterase